MQTGNLMRGETTCERYGRYNYRQMHLMHLEQMQSDRSYQVAVKTRRSIMSIDDSTNPYNTRCGNFSGMCCGNRIME